jgi:2-(1,2-epoxy-1,2-dihydrophenyl)acetyl-CoA isomerase
MPTNPSVLFEIKNNIAFITLNRPEKFNAFNKEMSLLLQDILDNCATNNAIRCLYITGNGKAFSAGQDLSELVQDNAPTLAQILSQHYNPIIIKLKELPKPIVCAVNGVAAGAGANIALGCDIVVAHEEAIFIQAFSKIGLIPDSGGTHILPRLIGLQKATALMMLGDKVMATEAQEMGMIYKVFNNNNFIKESIDIATKLASMPTKGLAYTKHVLTLSLTRTLQEQLTIEDEYQQKAANTKDYNEGVNAFLQKRTPIFIGE